VLDRTAPRRRTRSGAVGAVALATPVVLVAGWAVAGLLAGPSSSPVFGTLSDLAAAGPGAPVMTAAFVLTAAGLAFLAVAARRAGGTARALLALAAAAVVVVAARPVTSAPAVHTLAAFVALSALAGAPLAVRGVGRRGVPLTLGCVVATVWTLVSPDLAAGAVERVLTTVELVWLATVLRDTTRS
jgi:hypothetical protein